jgi:hypothetical protein
MNPLIKLKTITLSLLIAVSFACFGLSPTAKALLPPPSPDGGYPGGNTAEGINALHDVNTAVGVNNTAVGLNALTHDTTGQYNVAVGSKALENNTTGNFNMAIGTEALQRNYNASFNLAIGFRVGFMNTTGRHLTGIGAAAMRNNTTGEFNTAIGADALRENTTASDNTAVGAAALLSNTTGVENTATGVGSLNQNTMGYQNTAVGRSALASNTEGFHNTATGVNALSHNTIGSDNSAFGWDALASNTTGEHNTAIGLKALSSNTVGSDSTAIGDGAGGSLIFGDGNVYIGTLVTGNPNEYNVTRIRNIINQPITDGLQVVIRQGSILGVNVSSRRYKEDIKPMDKASERLFALKPVTFRAKGNMNPAHVKHYGLIAEDVAAVDPDLVVYNPDGKPEGLRFDSINAMLLNEFLKEHRKNEQQEATIARQQKQIDALSAAVQKVSAQVAAASPSFGGLEVSETAPQTVLNHQ